MIKTFLHHGHLLEEPNNTHITLIPPKKSPSKIEDFRPFSLCNVSYKFNSKLLTNRLHAIPPKIISPLQSVFASHREIHNNILIAGETWLRLIRREKKKRVLWLSNLTWKRLMTAWSRILSKNVSSFGFLRQMNFVDVAVYNDYYF